MMASERIGPSIVYIIYFYPLYIVPRIETGLIVTLVSLILRSIFIFYFHS